MKATYFKRMATVMVNEPENFTYVSCLTTSHRDATKNRVIFMFNGNVYCIDGEVTGRQTPRLVGAIT